SRWLPRATRRPRQSRRSVSWPSPLLHAIYRARAAKRSAFKAELNRTPGQSQIGEPSLRKRAVRPAVAHHLLAIRIERVVDDPLRRIERVVVLEAEMPEALGNSLEAGAFRLMIKRVVGIGAVDDLAQQHQRRIAGELEFLQDRLERALLAVMPELDVLHVIGNRVETFHLVHHLVDRREDELRVLVDEFPDKPRAGHAVDFYVFAGDPFHGRSPFGLSQSSVCPSVVGATLVVALIRAAAGAAPRHHAVSANTAARCERGRKA